MKIEIFAIHLSKVFKINSRKIAVERKNKLHLDAKLLPSLLLDISRKSFTVKEVQAVIKNLNSKAPDYDLITNRVL